VSARTYLSIGDVLSLLREEFPDVTISKIRFLESQGLVNPERSPSGYRKFFENDVERLRWVLRQQREHFLPLKVIRDRLSGDEDMPVSEIEVTGIDVIDIDVVVEDGACLEPNAEAEPEDESAHHAHNGSVEKVLRSLERTVAANAANAAFERERDETQSAVAPPRVASESVRRSEEPRAVRAEPAPDPRPVDKPAEARPERAPAAQAAEPEKPAEARPARPERTPRAVVASLVAGIPEFSMGAGLSGASLTTEELCAATGLAESDVAALEGFGLIQSTAVAGILCYDEEALTVAKLITEYAQFGIEPRHLRTYRNAVEREMGLVEQIVTPLLRQRNPESRQRAVDAAQTLAKLGQALHASLLRRELHRQLGH
jgi:DNA-binding transcriptional MerR regulator